MQTVGKTPEIEKQFTITTKNCRQDHRDITAGLTTEGSLHELTILPWRLQSQTEGH